MLLLLARFTFYIWKMLTNREMVTFTNWTCSNFFNTFERDCVTTGAQHTL